MVHESFPLRIAVILCLTLTTVMQPVAVLANGNACGSKDEVAKGQRECCGCCQPACCVTETKSTEETESASCCSHQSAELPAEKPQKTVAQHAELPNTSEKGITQRAVPNGLSNVCRCGVKSAPPIQFPQRSSRITNHAFGLLDGRVMPSFFSLFAAEFNQREDRSSVFYPPHFAQINLCVWQL